MPILSIVCHVARCNRCGEERKLFRSLSGAMKDLGRSDWHNPDFAYYDLVLCPQCAALPECDECDGSGHRVVSDGYPGNDKNGVPCVKCGGTGRSRLCRPVMAASA